MSTPKFMMTRDVNGYNAFGVSQSDVIYGGTLATDTAGSFTLPSDYAKYIVIFSFTPGANVFVSSTATAATPTGAIASRTVELNPQGRQYSKGTTISLITPDAAGAYFTASVFYVDPYTN
jgi:hypothetical protein